MKEVGTTKIESRYGADKSTSDYKLSEEFNTAKLENLSDAINNYFKQLQALSPDAYNQFSLGEFRGQAYAEVQAQGYGLGYGVSDRLTILASVPVYHIKTDVQFTQTKKSNLAGVKSSIANASTSSAAGNFIKDLTMALPETNEELLQSFLVNFYGYKPLGHFERDAFGDAELGAIYRLTNFYDKGQAIAIGTILPTGKISDPDSLQDVATGDGHYGAYIESLSGISFFDKILSFDFKVRYTYEFDTKKNLRMITDADVPLSHDKSVVNEKLGNKIDTTITATVSPTYWYNVFTSVIINKVGSTKYDIADPSIKSAMEARTNSFSEWGKIGLNFSTIELYKRKKFSMPFDLGVSYQRILSAQNSPDFARVDVDFRFYF